ncbi:DeoR/GlpR family DNA-binding transcription regulator [Sanguibacter inulinus]|uniref:Lactose phosphotransferase system repressor n=1 Tax=Sanguibacter inulinus TaxID=60922 RepID=A0A853EQQ5_9MICO|nr:DeoR/GlpR family DNA-binding transcription regulator [Sanguibacter inulinus]MBF0720937.1 DeoR/GlpR transcriptional regulator [Sanguibacter inulinus]NYS92082.1 DeoR/GlpR transcriptional regulator [Sanguibacter inulinus]
MLVAERHALLLDRLARDGRVVARALASELGLSEDTVRRDLRELAAAGLCQRVYGGAVASSPAVADYTTRTTVSPESKDRVGTRAARLVEPGMTVMLDGGTTSLAVVHALPADLRCTVVTHSPTVAVALLPYEGIEVLILGGRLFRHSAVTSGAAAVEAAAGVSADLFLLGVTGVHPEEGLTTGDADEAAMKRALSRRSAETVALASEEKIGAVSRYRVLPMDEVTAIVADTNDSTAMARLRERGVTVVEA